MAAVVDALHDSVPLVHILHHQSSLCYSCKVQTLQRVKGYFNQFGGLPSSRGGYQSTVRFVTGGAQSHGVTRILRHREGVGTIGNKCRLPDISTACHAHARSALNQPHSSASTMSCFIVSCLLTRPAPRDITISPPSVRTVRPLQ